MSKYHINPRTMRPNKCTATVRGCVYAKDNMIPEHYDTKEQARTAAEEQMAEKYGKTTQVKKTVKPAAVKKPSVFSSPQSVSTYNGELKKAAQRLGKVAEVEEIGDGIILFNASGESISFSFEGDCCSSAVVSNINVKPIDSPLKNIVEGSRSSEESEYGEFKDTRTWMLEYEDGTIQEFEDVNYNNGYYGNMVDAFAVFAKSDDEEDN